MYILENAFTIIAITILAIYQPELRNTGLYI